MIPYYCIASAAALLILIAANSFAIDFDPTFGSGGKFVTNFADTGQPSSSGTKVFLQPSGRIVVAGSHQQQGTNGNTVGFAMAGLTPAGLLDGNFGSGGKVVSWSADGHRFPTGFLMLPDGSIVVLYEVWQSALDHRPALAKFTASGQPDPSFQADVDLLANQTSPVVFASSSTGKIYVIVRNAQYGLFSLIRLNADGSRDATFGNEGVRILNTNRFAQQPRIANLTELNDGKLLLVGTYYDPIFSGNTFVTRLDSDTNIDRSFGTQGVTRLFAAYQNVGITSVRVQPDGKILLGGYMTMIGSQSYLARLTPRGRLDYTFGSGGFTTTYYGNINAIQGIAITPDGKIIVTGLCGDKAIPSNQRLFVARYSPTGVSENFLVTSFIGTREASSRDVVLQSDGKIVIGGYTQNASDNGTQLASARFIP